ncbi:MULTISPECIES: hypothetical protein [Proteus]|uniref:Uncharacterized protein n=1 Tax=Proteus columbae TaxID=1987580 RepID=A0A6I7D4H4_9GAMM|nr:hypothetical protein [Proteus columbae]QHN09695.1 hypothetical protein F1325_04100 [Proteus columbae]
MDITKIYQYKLRKLFNPRVLPFEHDILFLQTWEGELDEIISVKLKNKSALYLSWWNELFNSKKIDEIISDEPYDQNYYQFFSFLRILPNLLSINRTENFYNKNLFSSYIVSQLKSDLSFLGKEKENTYKTELINYLFYDMGFADYFIVEDNKLYFRYSSDEVIKVDELINATYDLVLKYSNEKYHDDFNIIKKQQIEIVNFLLEKDENFIFTLEDQCLIYLSPEKFIKTYKNDTDKIFKILASFLSKDQAALNVFVSKMIIMNYNYYILKNNPNEILKLKAFCRRDNLKFFLLLKSIIDLHFFVRKEDFKELHLEYYLSKIN